MDVDWARQLRGVAYGRWTLIGYNCGRPGHCAAECMTPVKIREAHVVVQEEGVAEMSVEEGVQRQDFPPVERN